MIGMKYAGEATSSRSPLPTSWCGVCNEPCWASKQKENILFISILDDTDFQRVTQTAGWLGSPWGKLALTGNSLLQGYSHSLGIRLLEPYLKGCAKAADCSNHKIGNGLCRSHHASAQFSQKLERTTHKVSPSLNYEDIKFRLLEPCETGNTDQLWLWRWFNLTHWVRGERVIGSKQ